MRAKVVGNVQLAPLSGPSELIGLIVHLLQLL